MTACARAKNWCFNLLLCSLFIAAGCRTTIPIHVWRPSKATIAHSGPIALVPLSGLPAIAGPFQEALLSQRPAVRSNVALLTAEHLIEASPIRLVSTDQLSNDLVALKAARAAGAHYVLLGHVVDSRLDLDKESLDESSKPKNYNQIFFQRLGLQSQTKEDYFLTTSWRVFEVQTGRPITTHLVKVHSRDIDKRFPDLQGMSQEPTRQLLTAAARETWKAVSPSVEKDQVRLAKPLFQPGSFRVRWGVRAAKKGDWPTAEGWWQSAADSWFPSPAAHHNLAIAKAAREDFVGAKQELNLATGWMSKRLPPETLVWLDQQHKHYCQALLLAEPDDRWGFEERQSLPAEYYSVPAVDPAAVPWWFQ
jgi:hypothetical protein